MDLSWRQRLLSEPEWYEFSRWPVIDLTIFNSEERRQYARNQHIVAAVLDGEVLAHVANRFDLSTGRISTLMTRCLGGPANAPPALTTALLPHKRLQQSERRSALPNTRVDSGNRCAFTYLLKSVEGLEEHLLKHIRWFVERSSRGQNLKPAAFHGLFIAYLESKAWPTNVYPFNTVSRGYPATSRYLKHHIEQMTLPKQPPRVIQSRSMPVSAFQEIQIDEAHLDCKGAVAVVLRGRMKPVRLGRISVLLARDVGTGCFLAGTIALTAHPNAADVLALLEQMIQPWVPLSLKAPGLSYASELGFPSALGEAFCRPAFGIIRLDNALAHLSHQVRRMACEHLCATCNFGLPKNPKARAMIEQAFRRLNIDVHRFPSTTGSHPMDPSRETVQRQKKPPYVSLLALEEAVSVLLTEFNHRPLANQGAVTPMEQIEYQMANHLLPLRASNVGPGLKPFQRMQQATVRRAFTTDAPRINFEGCQYQGDALHSADLINKRVNIVFDVRDIRTLEVVTLDGRPLGTVLAPRPWQRYAHSVSVRKRINQMIREQVFSARDPLVDYFNYTAAHVQLPKEALTYVRLDRENKQSDTPVSEAEEPDPSDRQSVDSSLTAALKRLPDWTPAMAKKRR